MSWYTQGSPSAAALSRSYVFLAFFKTCRRGVAGMGGRAFSKQTALGWPVTRRTIARASCTLARETNLIPSRNMTTLFHRMGFCIAIPNQPVSPPCKRPLYAHSFRCGSGWRGSVPQMLQQRVGVGRFELPTSCTPCKRAASCAIPRLSAACSSLFLAPWSSGSFGTSAEPVSALAPLSGARGLDACASAPLAEFTPT